MFIKQYKLFGKWNRVLQYSFYLLIKTLTYLKRYDKIYFSITYLALKCIYLMKITANIQGRRKPQKKNQQIHDLAMKTINIIS